jgi:hypothetical protein
VSLETPYFNFEMSLAGQVRAAMKAIGRVQHPQDRPVGRRGRRVQVQARATARSEGVSIAAACWVGGLIQVDTQGIKDLSHRSAYLAAMA